MNYRKVLKGISLMIMGQMLFMSPLNLRAQDGETTAESSEMSANATEGMKLFQGGKLLDNGGPSCITCHNVTNDQIIPGGLYAKDLTDVYTRFGDGLVAWLSAPSSAAMETSYKNNEITEEERIYLTAFLKHVNNVKETQTANTGYALFVFGGGGGLIVILILIQLIWNNRKKKMTKEAIFKRQRKAWDAKF